MMTLLIFIEHNYITIIICHLICTFVIICICIQYVKQPRINIWNSHEIFQKVEPPVEDNLLQVLTVQGIHRDIVLSKGDDYAGE